jgi:hypothetical protein
MGKGAPGIWASGAALRHRRTADRFRPKAQSPAIARSHRRLGRAHLPTQWLLGSDAETMAWLSCRHTENRS